MKSAEAVCRWSFYFRTIFSECSQTERCEGLRSGPASQVRLRLIRRIKECGRASEVPETDAPCLEVTGIERSSPPVREGGDSIEFK